MSNKQKTYVRFELARRIEHIVMLLSFGALGITGIPQRYADSQISAFIVNLFGGIEMTREIHHVAAVIMMFGTMYHILIFGYKLFVKRQSMGMLPSFQDAKDAFQALKYNFGLTKERPQMGRYTFEEKVEYWAFVWGTILMGATGFMMWNPIATSKILPGELIPAAKAAHGLEAILAVLAIIIWHMYSVHVKMFNKSMFTGKMTEEEMLHEHPLELADIKAGLTERSADPKVLKKRQRIYFPIAGVLTIAMLSGIYGFINTEETAVTIVPERPEQLVSSYDPQTPTPQPTLAPTATPDAAAAPSELTWDAYVGPLFQTKCLMCHGELGGLSLASYEDTMAGGQSGEIVSAGDSANSLLITIQLPGDHLGQLSEEELNFVKEWVDAGAPQ
ncbi:MAG: hypothetical protein GY755_00805 [Chloroflexi bacterium]|nr:hypothetical protein [Chloroflexota bacterium]